VFPVAPLASIMLTLQIVPYFMTGFESVPKAAEEAAPGFGGRRFFRAIAMALFVGAAFYVLAIGAAIANHGVHGKLRPRLRSNATLERNVPELPRDSQRRSGLRAHKTPRQQTTPSRSREKIFAPQIPAPPPRRPSARFQILS